MERFKFLITGTAISLATFISPLSALTFKDLEREISTARACPAPQKIVLEKYSMQQEISSADSAIKLRSLYFNSKINPFLFVFASL